MDKQSYEEISKDAVVALMLKDTLEDVKKDSKRKTITIWVLAGIIFLSFIGFMVFTHLQTKEHNRAFKEFTDLFDFESGDTSSIEQNGNDNNGEITVTK